MKAILRRTDGGVKVALSAEGVAIGFALTDESALDLAQGLAKAVIANKVEQRLGEENDDDEESLLD